MNDEDIQINSTFSVSPTNQQVSLNPGETYEGVIKINNSSDATEDFHYMATVAPYSVIGEEYAISLSEQTARTSISKWITILEPTGTIAPNSAVDMHFTITVPEDAPVGGQYATIVISSDEEAESQEGVNIQNIYEIASIIYGNVNGEIVHKGGIVENSIPEFTFSSPIMVGAVVVNEGNTHEVARVTITATDAFNNQSVLPDAKEFEQYDEFVIPDTTRYINHEITDLAALGVYKVTQSVSYNGQTSTSEKTVIVCPLWFIMLIILTICAIAGVIVMMIRKHRQKKACLVV